MDNKSYLDKVLNSLRNPLFPYWTASAYGFKRWISRYGYYPSFLPLCIYTDHGPGDSELSQIAALLERHKPTISRELARNTGGSGSRPKQACEMAAKRSEKSRHAPDD